MPLLALAFIAVAATAIRFYKLDGRSLWLDEIFQAETAHLSSAAQVVQFAQVNIDQMPLFFFFTWLLGRWGDSAFLLRLPSAVIGVAAVVAVYALGARLMNRRMGLVAAALMTVMPYAVWYSQEARNYALLMLLTTMQMYFAYRTVQQGQAVDWAGLAVVTLLNLYNHYLALLATVGVAAFIASVALISLLRPASPHVRVIAGIAVAAVASAAVLIRWRPLLKSLYDYGSGVYSRHHRPSLIVAAIGMVLAVGALVWLDLRLRSVRWRPGVLRQLELGTLAAAVVAVGYLPWLPYLRIFLRAPQQGIGRLDPSIGPQWGPLLGIAPRMGWSGLMLAGFVAGIATLAVWAIRGRRIQALLFACWLLVPTAVLASSARWAIVDVDIRYFAWLFPGAVLVTAAGVEGALSLGEAVLRRSSRRPAFNGRASAAAALVILGLLMLQELPALAAQAGTPKDDWRDTASYIAGNSPPGSVVISVGNYSDWAIICLSYYFREMHASLRLADGAQLTSDDVAALNQSPGAVWGVINHPDAAQLDQINSSSGREALAFSDVTRKIYVLRASASNLSELDQARELLRWEMPLEPSLGAPAGMLDIVAATGALGTNVLPAPDTTTSGWTFTPGATASKGLLALHPSGSEVDGTFSTSSLAPGDNLLLEFDHRGRLSGGAQVVFAIALDPQGHQLVATPSGAGFQCTPAGDWAQSYFAFQVPTGAADVVLVFRATGTGSADFQNIQLSHIS